MRATKLALLGVLTVGLAACGNREDRTAGNEVPPGSLPANAMAANSMDNSMSGSMGNATMSAAGATATLRTAGGVAAGTAKVSELGGALNVQINAEGLTPGDHGVHIHMTGKCEGPKFESAGGHWNPTSMKHGLDNPQGQHPGDMPNLVAGADGKGTLIYSLKGGTLAQLLDTDGAAFVIHAGKDDQKTDPAGASGDRVACGVFNAG